MKFEKLEALLKDLSDEQLDGIIDELGSATTGEQEDESRLDKIILIWLADDKDILEAIEKTRPGSGQC